MSLAGLQQMKREGRKIVAVVAWDYQIAQLADRAGVDLVSVGDSVGVNLWGRQEGEISLDEMLIVCKAVRRGVKRALVSCDLPPPQGAEAAVRLVREGGADMVKLNGTAEAVRAIVRAGLPVFAEFHGGGAVAELVVQAKRLEEAGASLLDFRHSGPEAGPAVVRAVSIPVLGGLGGGPWLDGRLRMVHAAIGYAAYNVDATTESYANVARITLDAMTAYAEDVRAGRHLKGQRPA
ncbi:MAG: 3-methyl-2-oxobutanoate hydroxymethyltransferase [Betaproteobacteria bacterium]|nr:MAG: 3-methyl-2-oxobutanoate hydroxymethyltransferase [Betaproteobacteria bacterium]